MKNLVIYYLYSRYKAKHIPNTILVFIEAYTGTLNDLTNQNHTQPIAVFYILVFAM